ncbi:MULTISPECIES: MarR family winged helix-turn-helix transcriptional regulator [Ramlibacter]|uniref:MarR family transcriptional regulator n=1 Tax=Ramlibacter pinisoli TaxID=2682844 RepID=A0A6N8IZM6_9BURK|nr:MULTISPECIES: MarR family transcriptional regulator [Ramlibacter]MBA2962112.1 MarR family transcriptional regulator [Ramlibacter sp. CGMCC 1.13660]MVQ32055.1 MarR family transcriptional regulator [Ramlibacter pinisoli]
MATDTSQPDLPAQLAVELHELVGNLRRRLREQADAGDLPPSQVAVLRRLERQGPLTVSALARVAGIRPQSMGATVAALQEAGLVTGTPDPADGRQTLLSLTPACRKWIRQNRAAKQDWLLRAIHAELSAREQQELARALALLNRVVHSQPAAAGGASGP